MLISKGWCVLFSSLLSSEWIRYYILAIMFYCFEGLLIVQIAVIPPNQVFNIEKSNAFFFHLLCLIVFAIMLYEMILVSNCLLFSSLNQRVDALFKTKIKMERMYRDGLNPYVHPT